MKLLINKFMLRHQGKLYKQGDCVDLPRDMAISLAEQSAGAYSLLPDVSECDTLEMPEVAPERDTLEMPEAVSESDTKETLESAPAKSKPRTKTTKAGTSRAAGKTASSSRAKK